MIVADYFQVYNDPTDVILKDIKVLLDEHNDSCMSLPKYGDTPPVFWIKMNLTILLGTLKPSFTLTLHGERLLCNRHGGKSSLQVSLCNSEQQRKMCFVQKSIPVIPKPIWYNISNNLQPTKYKHKQKTVQIPSLPSK